MKNISNFIKESSTYSCTVYLLVGIPGSGKSTWCKNNHPDLPVVSRDITRSDLGFTKSVDEKAVLTREQENQVTKINDKKMTDLIKSNTDFIIDDTNTGKFRKDLIKKLRLMKVKIIGVNFTTPLNTCIERRKGQIPEDIMKKLYKNKVDLQDKEVDKIITVK